MRRAAVLAAVLSAASLGAGAAEFRSVSAPAAILFDAPSLKARKLFILGAGYPVEITVALGEWTKVRDAAGLIAWIQTAQLGGTRTVMALGQPTVVRAAPEDAAEVMFQVEREVLLELLGRDGPWARVRHADGSTGFLRMDQAWGL